MYGALYWQSGQVQRRQLHHQSVFLYPEEGVEGSVLHELGDDHHGAALGHHSFQMDDVGVVKLAHDGCLAQEVPPLAFSVARLQCLNSHQDLSLPRLPEVSTAHLPKLT